MKEKTFCLENEELPKTFLEKFQVQEKQFNSFLKWKTKNGETSLQRMFMRRKVHWRNNQKCGGYRLKERNSLSTKSKLSTEY